jgi:hypothetical protein
MKDLYLKSKTIDPREKRGALPDVGLSRDFLDATPKHSWQKHKQMGLHKLKNICVSQHTTDNRVGKHSMGWDRIFASTW